MPFVHKLHLIYSKQHRYKCTPYRLFKKAQKRGYVLVLEINGMKTFFYHFYDCIKQEEIWFLGEPISEIKEKREKATGNKYGSKNGRMICSAKVIICKKVLNFLQSLGSRSKEDKRVFGDDTFLLQRIQMSTVLKLKFLSYFKPKG